MYENTCGYEVCPTFSDGPVVTRKPITRLDLFSEQLGIQIQMEIVVQNDRSDPSSLMCETAIT